MTPRATRVTRIRVTRAVRRIASAALGIVYRESVQRSISGFPKTGCLSRIFRYQQPLPAHTLHANKRRGAKLDNTSMSDTVAKAESPPPSPAAPGQLSFVALFSALCLAVLCQALDNTILATAIPKITDDFNSLADIGYSPRCAPTYLLLTHR